MKKAQFERILKALERTAELLKDNERARRAGRLLVYPSYEELQKDVNELRDIFERNRLFIIDIEESMQGLTLPEIELPEQVELEDEDEPAAVDPEDEDELEDEDGDGNLFDGD